MMEENEMEKEKKAGLGGEHYIPYEERKGNESIVYFTRDLSAEGLIRLYEKIKENLTGKVAVKLHTGEQHGPNIIPRPLGEGTDGEGNPQCRHCGNQYLL